MKRNRVALAVIATAGFTATGCGSDNTESNSDSQAATTAQAAKSKPKPKSARAQMVECIEGVGYTVTTDNDPNNLSINSPNGTLEAVAIIHPDAATAEKAAAHGREEGGLDDAAHGRAELILHAAKDTEARVISTCVADEYGG